MTPSLRALGILGLVLPCAASCGSGLALAPSGPHPPHVQEFVEVEYPPPPAQIEEISKSIEDQPDCAWIDGHYQWDGSWTWQPGRWVIPPEDCYYAAPVTAWSKTREPKLYYSPPRWYREDAATLPEARAVCPMPRACPGMAPANFESR